MSQSHVSNEEFFVRLSALFDERRQKDHGSIYLIQKRMTHGHESAFAEPTLTQPFPDLDPLHPLPIIIRATNGKSKEKRGEKIKLSTIVEVDSVEAFFAKYAEVCKSGMTSLKKRDRSKQKEKLKAKKRKQGAAAAAPVAGIEVKR